MEKRPAKLETESRIDIDSSEAADKPTHPETKPPVSVAKPEPEAKKEPVDPDVAREFKWREYSLHIDLYKFYFDLSLKANVFFYVVTGSILGFYLLHSEIPRKKLSLLLPILLSVILGGVFIWGAILWRKVTANIKNIREELNQNGLDIKQTPDVHLLFLLLLIFGIMFFGVMVSILILWRLT